MGTATSLREARRVHGALAAHCRVSKQAWLSTKLFELAAKPRTAVRSLTICPDSLAREGPALRFDDE